MFLGKRRWSIPSSALRWMMKITNNGPVSWGLILLFGGLLWPLYLLHVDEQERIVGGLDPYMFLSVFPIIVGSLLRALPGGLVAWFLTVFGFLIAILTGLIAWWPNWQFAFPCVTISGLIVALVTGYFRTPGLRLNQKLERRHYTHRSFPQLFFAGEDFPPVHAPSEQVEVKTTWDQIVEQAGHIAVTPPQATPHFDQNRYQMAIKAAGVGVYDWDITSDQHFWSNECKALLGLPPDAQEDFAYYRSLIHPEDREQVFSLFSEHYYAKTPHKLEYRLVWPDGSIHWIVDQGRFLFDQQGNPVRLIGVTWDITALKQLERQKDEFFCQIGHELRTPLTALKGNLQLIERHLRRWLPAHESSLVEEEKLLLQRLRRWNEQALRQACVENRLIENLLDASTLQTARLHLALEPCNLVQVVSSAVNDLQMVMPPHTLFYEACEHSDIPVMVDEARVGQVITQYVKNALPAATERSPIMVGISLGENAARVWVKDAGPGLSCEQQVSIWNLLCPASGLTGSQCLGGSGLGLGLYLCRELIRLHRGQIGVESVPGEGSTFWFTLPLREM